MFLLLFHQFGKFSPDLSQQTASVLGPLDIHVIGLYIWHHAKTIVTLSISWTINETGAVKAKEGIKLMELLLKKLGSIYLDNFRQTDGEFRSLIDLACYIDTAREDAGKYIMHYAQA